MLAGALLVASIATVPAAAASLGSVTDGGRAIVSQVTGSDLPTLPEKVLPQPSGSTPPAPVAIPSKPPVPAVGAPAATSPDSPAPRPASPGGGPAEVSSPGVDIPSTEVVTGVTNGATGTSTEAARPASAPAGGGGEGAANRGAPRSRSGAGSVEAAKGAPLGLLRAYIWPAVALGPAGELLATLLVGREIAIGPLLSNPSRLLLAAAETAGVDRVSGFAKGTVAPNPGSTDSRGFSIPSDSQFSLLAFIGLCAALVASLVLMVRRELRSMRGRPL